MSPRRRVTVAVLHVPAMLLAGTAGYADIGRIGRFDAYCDTGLTLATAGIQPDQSRSAGGRALTIRRRQRT